MKTFLGLVLIIISAIFVSGHLILGIVGIVIGLLFLVIASSNKDTEIKKTQETATSLKAENEKIQKENTNLQTENTSLQTEIKRMSGLLTEFGALDAAAIKAKIDNYQAKLVKLTAESKALDRDIKEKRNEVIVLDDKILLESFALYTPQFDFQNSDDYKENLDYYRQEQKDMIKEDRAATGAVGWTVNGDLKEGERMVKDMKKLLIRAFNNEADYCVDRVKFNTFDTYKNRIEKSYEALNKLGRITQTAIASGYLQSKIAEIHLAYEYQQKKQEEKEAQKKAREELREQQKLEQEIRQAREKIAKEKKHFLHAIRELEEKLATSATDAEKQLVTDKLKEVQDQYNELQKEEKVIDYREQNAKAGYVYIISNIGAFGENVYKIGMTRRLEPMDRIDELGDASVPFAFDVHALIFSDNAPALEAKLHEHFYRHRINKLNDRKEFFRADIDEIAKVIKENYNNIIDVIREAPAEQYRESLLIND